MNTSEQQKEKLLKLAGKLAISARLVTTSDAKNLSRRIDAMESVLDEYDNEVFSLLKMK